MAALPSPTQVAGSHILIYEGYYNQVDPNGYGRIGALDAARFLKKSKLSDEVLSNIWDMADPQSRGSLDKSGMFVALKLCAFAQAGRELNMANLSQDVPPPNMGDVPSIVEKSPVVPPPPVITSVNNGDWSIKPTERAKYDRLFGSLQPTNGYIPGFKVKGVLMDSKLPMDTLRKIWDLADIDKDGMLDRHEFVVAMHLVYKALEKYAIPSVLPPELMPPGKRKDIPPLIPDAPISSMAVAPPIPPLPNAAAVPNLVSLQTVAPPPQQQQLPPSVPWVVTNEDQAAADKLFLQADMDMDGFVSGSEIKDVFLQSGLPQTVLANIWALCDLGQSGKLNKEQFALSMWLIKQKLRGNDPPAALTAEMMPPSFRKFTEGVVENNNVSGYSNPELDMISKDIAELARERRTMEQDIAQKEADIKIKNGEIKSLQSELDTLAATLKQLENQRGEAQKRLNDLKTQVEKLRQQAEEQESVLRSQEDELNSKRQELEGLRQEEQQLEQQQNSSRDQLNELTKNLQNTQLQISQAKAKITNLEEQQRQMTDAIVIYDSALAAGDPTLVPDTTLQFNPEIESIDYNEDETRLNGVNDEKHNTKNTDTFAGVDGSSDGFGDHDPFSSAKAKDAFENTGGDPFANYDGKTISTGFTNDPFTAKGKQDPFEPYDDNKRNDKSVTDNSKDPFGDDPFANLHAPTRAESPSPALPPKKAKQPPPRPAPPRPSSGPTGPLRAAPAPPIPSPTPDPFSNFNSDPFAAENDNNNGNTGFGTTATGFADFANFDAKPDLIPSRTAPQRPVSRPRTTATPTPKLPDFTEDPFRDYRYEDPFQIADPFAEEDDSNANKKTQGKTTFNESRKLDPFGMETTATITSVGSTIPNKDPFEKGFESDFLKTSPLIKAKTDKMGNFITDTKNKSLKTTNELDFTNNSITAIPRPVSKPINFDEAFSTKKIEKTNTRSDRNIAQVFKDMLTHDNSQKNKNNNSNATWSNQKDTSVMLSEREQLAWASRQSLRAEEERCRRKAQEEADYALALELSKQETSDKF